MIAWVLLPRKVVWDDRERELSRKTEEKPRLSGTACLFPEGPRLSLLPFLAVFLPLESEAVPGIWSREHGRVWVWLCFEDTVERPYTSFRDSFFTNPLSLQTIGNLSSAQIGQL